MKLPPILLVLVSSLLSGCALGTGQVLPMPSQDVELTDPSLCRVYVARDQQTRGAVRKVTVFDGEQKVGTIAMGQYLCWERRPVRGLLTMVYDSGALAPEYEGLFDLQPEAGRVYYVAITIEPKPENPQDTSLRKPQARLLSEEEGRAMITSRSPAD